MSRGNQDYIHIHESCSSESLPPKTDSLPSNHFYRIWYLVQNHFNQIQNYFYLIQNHFYRIWNHFYLIQSPCHLKENHSHRIQNHFYRTWNYFSLLQNPCNLIQQQQLFRHQTHFHRIQNHFYRIQTHFYRIQNHFCRIWNHFYLSESRVSYTATASNFFSFDAKSVIFLALKHLTSFASMYNWRCCARFSVWHDSFSESRVSYTATASI